VKSLALPVLPPIQHSKFNILHSTLPLGDVPNDCEVEGQSRSHESCGRTAVRPYGFRVMVAPILIDP
jgi:hypothetical protein